MASADPSKRRCRILIAEDHPMVREGIVALIERSKDFEVTALCGTSEETLRRAAELQPHLVVLDYFLDDAADGAVLIRELLQLRPSPRILVLSMHRQEEIGERVMQAGAHGFISKRDETATLFEAIRAVSSGKLFYSPYLQALMLDRKFGTAPRAVTANLTDRELQVFRLLGARLGQQEIAERLGISARTVASHRENLKNKLGVDSAEDLSYLAEKWLRDQPMQPLTGVEADAAKPT